MSCPDGYYVSRYKDRKICKKNPLKKIVGKGTKKEFVELFRNAYKSNYGVKRVPKALVECTYEKYLANKNLTIQRMREYNPQEWEKLIKIAQKECKDYKILPTPKPISIEIVNSGIVLNLANLALVSFKEKKILKKINKELKDIIDEEIDISEQKESDEEFQLRYNRKKIDDIQNEMYEILNKSKKTLEDYKKIAELAEMEEQFQSYIPKSEETKPEVQVKEEEFKETFSEGTFIEDITDLIIENIQNEKKGTFGEFESLFRENYFKIYGIIEVPTQYIYCGYKSYSKNKSLTIDKLRNATQKNWDSFFNAVEKICA